MNKQSLTFVLTLALLNDLVYASPFRIVGTRAVGMGGAQVAAAEGVDAQYWNPAALAMTSGSGFQIPVNVSFEATGNLLEKADAIADAADNIKKVQDAQKNGGAITLQDVNNFNSAIDNILSLNSTGVGALIDANTGLQTRFGRVAVSFNQYADVGLLPIVDPNFNLGTLSGGGGGITMTGNSSLNGGFDTTTRDSLADTITDLNTKLALGLGDTSTNIANKLINDALASGLTQQQVTDLITQANTTAATVLPKLTSGSGDFSDNQTRVNLTGAAISEIALGYGRPIMESDKWGTLALGGNLKALRGEVGFARIRVVNGEDTSVSDAISDAKTKTETSVKPAVDLGALYRFPFSHRLQLGVLGRNLNSPKFNTPQLRLTEGLGDYKEKAQVRAGIAFWPLKRWALTADIDLTKNDSTIPGFKSQTYGVGTEFKLWLLDLRAGMMKNFEEDTPRSYSLGAGLNLGAFKINAGGAMSTKKVRLKTDGTEIPASAEASVTIGLVFGLSGEVKHKMKAADATSAPSETTATPTSSSSSTESIPPQ